MPGYSGSGGSGRDAVDGRSLPGRTKAFFYAGNCAILVSHWSVDTTAMKNLPMASVTGFASDPRWGEAMHRAMTAMIEPSEPHRVRH